MTLYKNKYRVESTRLKNYDYTSDGAYFITICTKDREYFFGEIKNSQINTPQTKIAAECWRDLPKHYPNCVLDEFIIMPNHVHGIIIIDNNLLNVSVPLNTFVPSNMSAETGFKPVSTDGLNAVNINLKQHSLSEMIRAFKTFTARRINEMQNTRGQPFWQERFYDRIIRNGEELKKSRNYIIKNPERWELNKNNSKNIFI
ncbi:MAG: transposase [bacterium]